MSCVILRYIVSLKPAWAISDPVSQTKNKTNNKQRSQLRLWELDDSWEGRLGWG